jgi:outer membrane protein assembly factor BamB
MRFLILAFYYLIPLPNNHFLFGQINPSQQETIYKNEPKTQWKFLTGGAIYASPIANQQTIYFGSLDNNFYAIELKTGKLKWTFKTKGQIKSTALFFNNSIYFISGDGKLYCLDSLGKQRWAFSEGSEKNYDFADYHQSAPVIYENRLYFGLGDGYMYAINPYNGKLIWKFKTNNVVHTKPVFENGKMYFGSFDGNVYALNCNTGNLIWKFKTVGHQYFPKGEVQGSPTLSKTAVIIGARDYNVYAIDKEKGFCLWNKAFTKGWVLVNYVQDSTLYMAGADERIIAKINPETGQEYWKKDMEFLVFGKPTFHEKMLFIGTTMGKIHGIDADTGNKIWTVTTDLYKKNRLKYLKEDDTYRDDIYSIIKTNEEFLGLEIDLGGIFSTPILIDENILFTSTDGGLYCLKF